MRFGLYVAPLLMALAACSAGPSGHQTDSPKEMRLAKLEADLEQFIQQLEVQLGQMQALVNRNEDLRAQLARTDNERKVLAQEVELYKAALQRQRRDW
jgi:hypothetical protein